MDAQNVEKNLLNILKYHVYENDPSKTTKFKFQDMITQQYGDLRLVSMGPRMLNHISEIYKECATRSLARVEAANKSLNKSTTSKMGKYAWRSMFGSSGENKANTAKREQLIRIRNEGFCALSDLFQSQKRNSYYSIEKVELEVQIFNRYLVILWEFLKIEVDTIIGEACELMFKKMTLADEYKYAKALLATSEIIAALPKVDRLPCNLFEFIIEKGITRDFKYDIKKIRNNLHLFDIETASSMDLWMNNSSNWSNLVNKDADFKYCHRVQAKSRDIDLFGWLSYGEDFGGGGGDSSDGGGSADGGGGGVDGGGGGGADGGGGGGADGGGGGGGDGGGGGC